MNENFTQRELIQQNSLSDCVIFSQIVENYLKNLHTCLPGTIQSFDSKTQTASVQPMFKRMWEDGTSEPLPVCLDVPVIFPSGGGFSLTFPIQKGDLCLLLCMERSIDTWWQFGNLEDTKTYRMHSLSDAVAIIGAHTKQTPVQTFNEQAVCLQSKDEQYSFSINKDGTINIKAKEIYIQSDTMHVKGSLFVDTLQVEKDIRAQKLHVTQDVQAGSVSLLHHKHGGVQTGSFFTTSPVQSP